GARLSPVEKQFIAASVDSRNQSIRERQKRVRLMGAIVALLVAGIGAAAGVSIIQYGDAQRAKVALAETTASLQSEANRTDLSGSLTVFGTPYGVNAMEKDHRGAFTGAVEKHLFRPYVSISTAINLAQRDVTTLFSKQRGEVLSSMNADVFLN